MAGSTNSAASEASLPKRVEQGMLADPGAGFVGDEVGFGGPQVCKIVGISYRQLDYWARTDLLRPSLADAAGGGTPRPHPYRDLLALKGIKRPPHGGLSLQTPPQAAQDPRGPPRGDPPP